MHIWITSNKISENLFKTSHMVQASMTEPTACVLPFFHPKGTRCSLGNSPSYREMQDYWISPVAVPQLGLCFSSWGQPLYSHLLPLLKSVVFKIYLTLPGKHTPLAFRYLLSSLAWPSPPVLALEPLGKKVRGQACEPAARLALTATAATSSMVFLNISNPTWKPAESCCASSSDCKIVPEPYSYNA